MELLMEPAGRFSNAFELRITSVFDLLFSAKGCEGRDKEGIKAGE